MKIQQISVFLENSPGKLGELCNTLAQAGVNLSTLSLADTGKFGLLRIITPEVNKARQAIEAAGYAVTLTDVVALQVPHRPGGLAHILAPLEAAGIGIEYMYAFATRTEKEAVMVFRFSDTEQAIPILQGAGVSVYRAVDLLGAAQ